MLKKTLAAFVGVAALAGSGVVLSTAPAHPANTETGSVYHGAEYAGVDGRLARVDNWNRPVGAPASRAAKDAWDFIGGESGWVLRQHSYDFANGRLVHSDTISHDSPKPISGRDLLSPNDRGADGR
ncbi:MAG: hypothetical protein ABIQ84_03385 [Usitatibacter sp.]